MANILNIWLWFSALNMIMVAFLWHSKGGKLDRPVLDWVQTFLLGPIFTAVVMFKLWLMIRMFLRKR